MNREETIERIKNSISCLDFLEKSKYGNYCCPVPSCGSGRHKNGTGAVQYYPETNTAFCHSCNTRFDVIELYKLIKGVDFNTAVAELAEQLNNGSRVKLDLKQPAASNQTQQPAADYTQFFLLANKNIAKTSYHRGLTLETLNRFKVGYVAEWTHPKAPTAPASPRLIIPTSKHSYLARDTREQLTDKQKTYSKSKVGCELFNKQALQSATRPVFVVEGEIDAMSIEDCGYFAVGLGSTANVKKLLAETAQNAPKQPLIIALDNEDNPNTKKAADTLQQGLQEQGAAFIAYNPCGTAKDANEALNRNRAAFKAELQKAEQAAALAAAPAAEQAPAETDPAAELEKVEKEAAAFTMQNFFDDIKASKEQVCYPTGFKGLDKILDGGLYAGLYIVGAVSSLGKTTFCLQVADQIAQGGQDVLIFSLEMARNELIAKSVSRLTLIGDLTENGSTANAKTTRGILTGSWYDNYSQKETDLIQSAGKEYAQYAKHIYISCGVGDIGVFAIRERVERHKRVTGRTPVVLIDYLQILAPVKPEATDKQNTDKAVLELKRLSRDFGVPVIGISSFNRDNYKAPVNTASFKESGAIEYSSDILLGLQYKGMDYRPEEKDGARDTRIRKLMEEVIDAGKKGKAQRIQVKVLKNRNGSKGDTELDFYPMFNYFTDNLAAAEDDETEPFDEDWQTLSSDSLPADWN